MDQKPTIRILRPGTFTSVEGKAITFGQAELRAIAEGYDPAGDPAPLVVGHPKIDDPAFGWVGRLSIEGDVLVAHPDRIDASFADQVRKGDYAKVSAQLYEPDNPHNPKPGQFYLKHVGFLGAHAPGVKSLGTVQFAAGDEGETVTIQTEPNPKEDPMGDKPTKDTTTAGTQEVSFAERETELARREQALEQREKEQSEAASKARHDANVTFAEGLVSEAKLAPAGKDLVIGVLDTLGGMEPDATVSFGEGDSAQSMAPVAAFRKLLQGAGTIISLGEAAPKKKGKTAASVASFAAPSGYTVHDEDAALHAEAKRIQAGSPGKPFMDCVREAEAALAGA